jgi:molecular chaperone GrpE
VAKLLIMFGKLYKNRMSGKKNSETTEKESQEEVVKNEANEASEAATPETPETEVAAEQDEISKLKAENEALQDKYLRLYSDFENYKRRTSKERIDLFKMAGQDVLKSLLPVMDDFDRAEKAFETAKDVQSLADGVKLVSSKLKNTVEQQGLKAYVSVGEVFNADLHEAITKIPAPSDDLKGKVVDEVEKGYMLHDKVLRFAKVVVGE